ncbi:tryptophan halogenase family protein [Nonomuraea sp. CA-141351]|uniref:tryptophan halogenase family protein n=1 Tax=Nonomuraea sp. CA-141351 TaxID=3239996 RepID=UPI003D8D9193
MSAARRDDTREWFIDHAHEPSADDHEGIRRIGIIGGGTAGYLTALALKARRPWLDVTLVESSGIPIIGVGEATVPSLVVFLHHYLGIDPDELYDKVRPTWKLGIKFEWGPDPEGFVAPFDWDSDSIGVVGSLRSRGNINDFTLQALLMRADRTPIFANGGRPESLMKHLRYAYHLDNARFVTFLSDLARRRGVRHIDARIAKVIRRSGDWIDSIVTEDGRELRFDFYVDCSGFRSLLLGKTLETPFLSYADSLFTDSAVTGNLPHHGHLKPYTTATTMSAGWCWSIPTPESDHLGYVYSSSALSDEEAAAELATRFPGISEPRIVRFRSGRHEQAWRGNVMGIGNSYAFVEPLESSGIYMITLGILGLLGGLPGSWREPAAREVVNAGLARKWDALRWFLAIHYRFNTRLDTPFWKTANHETDVSGIQHLLDLYAAGAPLRQRDAVVRDFAEQAMPTFYGIAGVDTILLGQHVRTSLLPQSISMEEWHERKAAAELLVKRALPLAEALDVIRATPEIHQAILEDEDSWAGRGRSFGHGFV